MFGKLARTVVMHPVWVIVTWLIAAVAILALSPQLVHFTSNNNSTFLPAHYESVRAQDVADRYFPSLSGAGGTIVVSSTDGEPLTTSQQAAVAALPAALQAARIPAVESVTTSPLYLSPDKKVQLVQVEFSGQAGDPGPNAAVPLVRAETTRSLAGTGLRGQLTGNASISVDSTTAFDNAETIITLATVLLIVLLLGLIFRSVIIAVLPIVIIGIVHQMAQALTAALADWLHFEVGAELAPLLVVVMFGVGTDYIVFILYRYREQMAAGHEQRASLLYAVEHVGEVITSAAGTVIAAFAALLVATLGSLRTLAPGLIVGVALMLLAAMTLVPAIFSLLGTRLFWPTQPRARRSGHRTYSERAGNVVFKRPGTVLAVFGGVLVLLALGTAGYKTTYNQLAELPTSTLSSQAFATMAGSFPAGYLGPTQVYVTSTTGGPLDPAGVTALSTALAATSGVSAVAPATYTADRGQAVVNVLLEENPYSVAAISDVAGPVRTTVHDHPLTGATAVVGGVTSTLVDVRTALWIDIKHIFPLALLIVLVILALLLRAIVAPLYLLAGVVLTYAATLGTITLVFLDSLRWSGLDFSLPIVVYLFVIAIGTDYNILISSRLREEFNAGQSPREAARVAVVHGAPAVTSAGVILAGTFASLILTGIQLLQEIGLAVAVGVLLTSNVLASRVVPALAALRGWHFWWPHRIHRRMPTVGPEQRSLADPAEEPVPTR